MTSGSDSGSGSNNSGINATSVPNSNDGTLGEEQQVKKARPSYALPDTHTTILPVKLYFCFTKLDQKSAILKLRTNSLYDYMVTQLTVPTATPSPKIFYNGLFNKNETDMYYVDNYVQGVQGPLNGAVDKMYWRDYWAKRYKHYHVMGMEMSLTLQNHTETPFQVGMLTYSDETAPPDYEKKPATADEAFSIKQNTFDSWKNTKRTYIPGSVTEFISENSAYTTTFREGRKTLTEQFNQGFAPKEAMELHKVANNTVQSQVWTKVGDIPSHVEYVNIYFWSDLISQKVTGRVNAELNLKFLVQFRDLRKHLEYFTGYSGDTNYPITGDGDFTTTTAADIVSHQVF